MNQIIYFHGYASEGNSRTAENIRQELTNYQIISPKYDTKNADKAYNDLSNMVDYGCKKSDCF